MGQAIFLFLDLEILRMSFVCMMSLLKDKLAPCSLHVPFLFLLLSICRITQALFQGLQAKVNNVIKHMRLCRLLKLSCILPLTLYPENIS